MSPLGTPLLAVLLLAVLQVDAGDYHLPFGRLMENYGPEHGDSLFPLYDDLAINVPLKCNYKFYGEKYKSLYLSSNGYVTFYDHYRMDAPMPLCYADTPIMAPLWSDVFLASNSSLYYRETQDPDMLAEVRSVVNGFFSEKCGCGFEPQCMFLATWENVDSYCDHYPAGRNTFQMAFVTDNGRRSYVIFDYRRIEWTDCRGYSRAGFGPGAYSDNPELGCYELPYSGTEAVSELANSSNVGIPGMFMFEVDGSKSRRRLKNPDCEKIGNCCDGGQAYRVKQ